MGYRSVLANREDIRSVEAEEQLNFVLSVLQESGISDEIIETCFTDGQVVLSIDNKIVFRKICEKNQISILDDTDGGVKIYIRSENKDVLIAEWYKPNYILRIDNSILDKSKRIFVEISTRWWTIFEEHDGKKNK